MSKLHPDYILRIALAIDKLDRRNPTWWCQYAGGLDACIGCGNTTYYGFNKDTGKEYAASQDGGKFKHNPDCPAGYLPELLKRARKEA